MVGCCADPFYFEKEKRNRDKIKAESERKVAEWINQIRANETTFEAIRVSGQATYPELRQIETALAETK